MNRQRGIAVLTIVYMVFAAVAIGSVWKAVDSYGDKRYEQGKREVQQEWNEAVDKQAAAELEAGDKASKAFEVDRGKTQVVYRTITKSVDKYIDRPVYRNVCFDDDGLRDANAALGKATAANPSKPPATLSEARGVGKRSSGDSAPKVDRSGATVLRVR